VTLKELIEKGTIDIVDDITFQTHAEVLRLFGSASKVVQRSFVRHPVEEDVWISFWIFYQDDSNDWENTWGLKEEIAFERRKFQNDEYLADMAASPDRHTRLLFAKIAPFGRVFYKFKGVYVFDPELSFKARKCAYRRTATTARLYPVGV
jgi:hypothetical protein